MPVELSPRRAGGARLRGPGRICALLVSVAALVAVLGGLPGAVSAAPFASLGSFGSPNGVEGGQLQFPRGVAVNVSGAGGVPAGSVYVAEAAPSHRVSQFTAGGEFVRAWGFDVIVAARPDSSVPPNSNGTGFEVCDVTAGNVASDCKAGVAGAAAGQLANPLGVAVDQSNGYLYVPSSTNRRVDVFSGSGEFAGAFGWGVDTGAAAPEVCTTASTCQIAGAAGGDAGRFGALLVSNPAVDPSVPGRVLVPDPGNLRVAQYSTTIAGGVLTAASFDKAFGWDVVPGGAAELESCTTATTCQASQPVAGGNNPGQFTSGGSPAAVAVDSTGAIYVTSGPLTNGTCSAAAPCRIQKFAPDASSVSDFGPSTGPGQLTFTSGTAATVAAVGLAIDPDNDHVYLQRRESASSYRILEYDSDGDHIETHPGGNALTTVSANNLSPGLAAGIGGRVYASLGAGPASGQSRVFIVGPIDPPGVAIEPVTGVSATAATFNGVVEIPEPGAPTFDTIYRFEYTSNGIDWTRLPAADVTVPGGSPGLHPVSQAATGLQPNTAYTVRLVASTGTEPITSTTTTFTTDTTAPTVAMSFVDEVTKTQARLGAHIDPEGLDTTYRFEWGTEPCSTNPGVCVEVPGFDRQIGDGNKPVIVFDPIAGLEKQSTYHYRVIAANSEGTTYGPDQTFETLNDCNLTNDRCYELVSPVDKGPVGAAGDRAILGSELAFQVAPLAPSIAYTMAYGLPDSTSGSEVVYRADRDGSGWSSIQLEGPAKEVRNAVGAGDPSYVNLLSSDLSCGVYLSGQPLVEGGPTAALDAGDMILYRRDAEGVFTPLPDADPSNPYTLDPNSSYSVGVSEGSGDACERVVFVTPFEYPGVGGPGRYELYRWDGGVLSNVGVVAGPDGPETVAASPGAPTLITAPGGIRSYNFWNAVSVDGSRVFFSARRLTSPAAGEIDRLAVFVRQMGSAVAVDVSLSQVGGVANDGPSRYETASTDGKHVFFTAKSGLAQNGGSGGPASCDAGSSGLRNGPGCDLYRYSVDEGVLSDLSAPAGVSNSGGAGVAGVIGASDDGMRVYFVARGQLVPGEGPTENENLAADTYSVYLSDTTDEHPDGRLAFIGTLRDDPGDMDATILARSTPNTSPFRKSRVTPDGRHLLFESRAAVAGYVGDGVRAQAFLYDLDDDEAVCISCRRDGKPLTAWPPTSDDPLGNRFRSMMPIASAVSVSNALSPPRSVTDDGRRVFFQSFDRLAVGATEGQRNLYQWEEGQISFLANSSPSTNSYAGKDLQFAGASATGDDVYFTTVDRYSWQDLDAKLDIYDARVGGGFAQPPAPQAPCDPLAPGSCSSPGAGETATSPSTDKGSDGQADSGPRAVLSLRGLSRAQRARLAAGRRVVVGVRVSGPGRVSVSGTARIGGFRVRVLSGTRQATGAGVVRVPVTLSKPARRRAARSGLRITVVARLQGARRNVRTTVALTKAKRARAKTGKGRAATPAVRPADTDGRQGQ